MPTYSYLCTECAHEFERVQRITEDAIKVCPSCGKPTAKRQLQSGNFILKGSGWYGDLYSGASNKKAGADAGVKDAKEAKDAGGEEKAGKSEKPAAPAAEGGGKSEAGAKSEGGASSATTTTTTTTTTSGASGASGTSSGGSGAAKP